MNPLDQARARHRLYALLGELVARGPVPEAVEVARELPALAFGGGGEHPAQPAAGATGRRAEDPDPDALAAGHHAAIVGALPWESAWTSPDGQLGGPVTDAVRRAYADGGFAPAGEEPDHLGLELAYLAHLCAAEAEALQDGVDPEPVRARQRTFLDRHLGRWLPPLVAVVRDAGEPAWTSVVELAADLAESHREALGGPREPWSLAGTLPDPDDPELGLGGIARALVTPARSGWMPSAAAFQRIADAAGVPSGFGDRVGRMLVILRSAADAGRLPVLVDALIAELGQPVGAESGSAGSSPWGERRAATIELVRRLAGAGSA